MNPATADRYRSYISRLALALALALLSGSVWGDDLFTQVLELNPGWNAVFLEVQPEPSDPATVFAGIPVDSVWTWSDRSSAVQFLVDPAELEWNRSGWLGYRTAAAEKMLTDLYSIVANQTYLIKTTGAATWSVTGRPSTAATRWLPDSFNLVGFHLDPTLPISLGAFFAPSTAHAGQAVYKLDPVTGLWQFLDDPFAHTASAGEAYWVYCEGASTYQGPWFLGVARADGIDFGASLRERLIRITNVSDTARSVQVRELSSPNPVAVVYKSFDQAAVTFEWQPLASMPAISVPARGAAPLTLAVRRESLAAPEVGSVLELKDGAGIRFLIPVRAAQ